MVFVARMGAVVEDFKGTSKAWSRYCCSPAFRCESGNIRALFDMFQIAWLSRVWQTVATF
jgi:hypothetical protein